MHGTSFPLNIDDHESFVNRVLPANDDQWYVEDPFDLKHNLAGSGQCWFDIPRCQSPCHSYVGLYI